MQRSIATTLHTSNRDDQTHVKMFFDKCANMIFLHVGKDMTEQIEQVHL